MMKLLNLILLIAVLQSFSPAFGQQESNILSGDEIAALNEAMADDTLFAQVVRQFGDPVKLYEHFKLNLRNADSIWSADQQNLAVMGDIGVTERFVMLPLIDYFTGDSGLIGEAGVSYLIETDDATILFDVGLNSQRRDPSPLLHNMEQLGIGIDDIDVIVISHNHGDHVGGNSWSAQKTFSLTGRQIELGEKKIYTPEKMTYPGQEPIFAHEPVKIAEGVATIGVIPCPMFFSYVGEQAIAVNVKNRGIVVISGCGHQTIEKIVYRAEKTFDKPLYGLIGGFHLPVTESRHITKIYSWLVTGKLPWDSLTKEDVETYVALLKQHGVKLVGISGHDSCDWSIQAFKKAYQDNYMDIAVGQRITLKP